MKAITVYIQDKTQETEEYFIMNGYRDDILVKVDKSFYLINCITITLLSQYIKIQGVHYYNSANLFLVPEVSFKTIINEVIKHEKIGYFDNLKVLAEPDLSTYSEIYRT